MESTTWTSIVFSQTSSHKTWLIVFCGYSEQTRALRCGSPIIMGKQEVGYIGAVDCIRCDGDLAVGISDIRFLNKKKKL